jgi:hypothetical protein
LIFKNTFNIGLTSWAPVRTQDSVRFMVDSGIGIGYLPSTSVFPYRYHFTSTSSYSCYSCQDKWANPGKLQEIGSRGAFALRCDCFARTRLVHLCFTRRPLEITNMADARRGLPCSSTCCTQRQRLACETLYYIASVFQAEVFRSLVAALRTYIIPKLQRKVVRSFYLRSTCLKFANIADRILIQLVWITCNLPLLPLQFVFHVEPVTHTEPSQKLPTLTMLVELKVVFRYA